MRGPREVAVIVRSFVYEVNCYRDGRGDQGFWLSRPASQRFSADPSAEVSGSCVVASNETASSHMHASALQPMYVDENIAPLLSPVRVLWLCSFPEWLHDFQYISRLPAAQLPTVPSSDLHHHHRHHRPARRVHRGRISHVSL